VSRRLLSPLESIERDAIVQSLQDHDGNKVRAAEALGMSRATIYRKITSTDRHRQQLKAHVILSKKTKTH